MEAHDLGWIIRAAGPIAGGALLWLTYFDLKDSLRPEPRRALLLGFLLGAAATVLAAATYRVIAWFGLPNTPSGGPRELFWFCVAIVGPIEESAKFLLAAAILFRLPWFDEPVDGVIYASTVGIGFATVENFVYAGAIDWYEQLARAVTSPLIHSLFSSLWGITAAWALLGSMSSLRRVALLGSGLAAASVLHGLYDAALLTWNAPWLSSLIALALWIVVLVFVRRAIRSPARRP